MTIFDLSKQLAESVYDIHVRFVAIVRDIDNHIRAHNAREDPNPAVLRLMRDLRQFSIDYYQFFQSLHPSEYEGETTQAELLSRTLSKLTHEWAAIRLASEQRVPELYLSDLKLADQRAQEFYQAFRGSEPEATDVAMVTYFHKIQDIARFPYSRVPLIGLPLSVTDNDPANMAIAHEVGHYVYWHAPDLSHYGRVAQLLSCAIQERLVKTFSAGNVADANELQKLARHVETWQQWGEECFADGYGCLVAGPLYALAAQDLFIPSVGCVDDLGSDDGTHPIVCLRPKLQSQILRQLAEHAEQAGSDTLAGRLFCAADLLDRRWLRFCQRLPGSLDTLVHDSSGRPVCELEADLAQVADAIVNTPVLDLQQNGELTSLLDSITPFGTETDAAGRQVEEIIEQIQADLDLPNWAPEGGAQILGATSESPSRGTFGAIKVYLKARASRQNKPLWKLMVDLALADTAPHLTYKTHVYTRHWTKHHDYHNHPY